MYIVRGGVLLAVPADYADSPDHRALIDRLSITNRYLDAVQILESVPLTNWLAADVLTGAAWARRYQNTTARLWVQDKALAGRGLRALMRVLSGHEPKVGRQRKGPMPPETAAKAAAVLAHWRVRVDAAWVERETLGEALTAHIAERFPLSTAHRRALKSLIRRQRLKKADVVLTLASWETGIPLRRLRAVQPVADLVYS